jgi:hypothetical protein
VLRKPGKPNYSILNKTKTLRTRGTEVPRNDTADHLAKKAISPQERHIFRRSLASQKKRDRHAVLQEWQKVWQTTEKGKHLRRIDDGLPSKHTRKLYGPRERNRAYLLAQLRTGHSWLASHAKILRFSDDKCACRAREIVVHVRQITNDTQRRPTAHHNLSFKPHTMQGRSQPHSPPPSPSAFTLPLPSPHTASRCCSAQ